MLDLASRQRAALGNLGIHLVDEFRFGGQHLAHHVPGALPMFLASKPK